MYRIHCAAVLGSVRFSIRLFSGVVWMAGQAEGIS
jgi:hypothetical protein